MALLESTVNIGLALLYKYPNSQTIDDHFVRWDSDKQKFVLETWNLPDPVPTEQDMEQWYLEYTRQSKLSELAAAREAAIYAHFQSNCTGAVYTYAGDDRWRMKYDYLAMRAHADSTYQESVPTEEAGWIVHTAPQLIQLADDAHAHEKAQWDKYNRLVAQLQAATTVDGVNSITW